MSEGEPWLTRFERAGPLKRAALLGGGAVRLAANLIEKGLDRAARTAAEAEHAFRRELDSNVTDAKILEEHDERRHRRPR